MLDSIKYLTNRVVYKKNPDIEQNIYCSRNATCYKIVVYNKIGWTYYIIMIMYKDTTTKQIYYGKQTCCIQ